MTATIPTSLAAFVPATDAFTLALADVDGTIYTATIPAGAFAVNRSGSRLTFRDLTGTVAAGLTRVTLTRTRTGVRLVARGRNLDLAGADQTTVTTTIQLGAQPFRSTNVFRRLRARLLFP